MAMSMPRVRMDFWRSRRKAASWTASLRCICVSRLASGVSVAGWMGEGSLFAASPFAAADFAALLWGGGLEDADVGEVAVALFVIEAVAYDELIGNLEAHIGHGYVEQAHAGPVEESADA